MSMQHLIAFLKTNKQKTLNPNKKKNLKPTKQNNPQTLSQINYASDVKYNLICCSTKS